MNNEVTKLRDLDLEAESLKARKNAIKQKLAEHRDEFSASQETRTETRSELEKINQRLTEIQSARSAIAELAQKNQNKEERKINMENNEMNKRSSMEYRKAFMDYIQRGAKSEILEFRENAFTHTTDAASVIPTTIIDEIVKESKIAGNILSKVRKMNVKGGVKIPTMTAIPVAEWIDEDNPSDRKKVQTGSVTFSYYGLEIKIAQSLLSEYVSIDAFEREFVTLAVEAMTNAKEIAIFNGTGSGQPTGILTDSVTSVTLTAENLVKYDKLYEAIGKLPAAYRAGAEFAMNAATWDKIVGMVDSNGQPVARINYGLNGASMSLFGYPVNLVEADRIKGIDTASAGTDYIIVLGQFNKYAINSNGDLGVIRYRDNDANQDVTKALEFVDGKVLDKKAFLKIKLGA